MFESFTPEARHSLLFAQRRAAACHMEIIGVVDIVHGVLADGVWASTLLTSVGVDPDEMMEPFVLKSTPRFYDASTPMDFTSEARRALARSKKLADRYEHAVITSAHVFVACLTVRDPEVDPVAQKHSLSTADLAAELESKFGLK